MKFHTDLQYGGKTDFDHTGLLYGKIDLFYRDAGGWVYACSTEQWRLVQDAVESWSVLHLNGRTHDSRGRAIVKGKRA